MAIVKKFSAIKKIQKHLLGIQNLSVQEAKSIGIHLRVLEKLINRSLLDQLNKDLEISIGDTFLLMAFLIVIYLSRADIPVVTPFFASIETVNAVWLLDILLGDIKDKFNLSACF